MENQVESGIKKSIDNGIQSNQLRPIEGQTRPRQKTKMQSSTQNLAGLKKLSAAHSAQWLTWVARVENVLKIAGLSMKTENVFRDFDWTQAEFEAAGFSADEAGALIFAICEDGVTDMDGLDRWFILNRSAIAAA